MRGRRGAQTPFGQFHCQSSNSSVASVTDGHIRRPHAGLASRATLAFAFALVASAALADQFLPASGGWQTYINDRYGARFDFPAGIFSPARRRRMATA